LAATNDPSADATEWATTTMGHSTFSSAVIAGRARSVLTVKLLLSPPKVRHMRWAVMFMVGFLVIALPAQGADRMREPR
jgi:hypothetical protein